MTIICLEGPSAVGKTTTCRLLSERFGAYIVPEVNAPFERPKDASATWCLERQVDRWQIAVREQETHSFAVLDGDPFQPFWYNWTFGFDRWQSLESLIAFYRPLIEDGIIRFPDRYVLLTIAEAELRHRKDADTTRSRRNFDSHLILGETLPRYFAAMADVVPGLVIALQAIDIETTAAIITVEVEHSSKVFANSLLLFDSMIGWFMANRS